MQIKFIKRDGSIENYNEHKIIKVLIAAGLEKNDAENISQKITKLILKTKELQTNSLQVRNFVIEELKKIDPNIANFFLWYEKTKN
jgi:transcriptional regulator NrdR family protein